MSFLGGGSTPQINYTPSGISNPTGFSISNNGNVSQSGTLSSNIGSLQSTFGQQASAFGALGATVQPGFSQFRQTGLLDIANQFMAQRSNLQDTLAKRRILGSSFANSEFSELAATEAQTKADFEAQSYLQELQASQELIQSQYTAQANSYQSAINQSNLESTTAAQFVSNNNSIMAQVATANANLQANSQAAAGKGIGSLIGTGAALALAPFTGGASLLAVPGILAGSGGGGGGGNSGNVASTQFAGGGNIFNTPLTNPNMVWT